MMKPRTLAILGGVLVLLAVLSWTTSRTKYSTAAGGGFDAVLGESVDPGSIEKLRAWIGASPDSLVELARAGDGWEGASRWGWPAKTDQVQKLLDDLEGLKGEKRASSKDVFDDFRIDDEGGLHVVGLGAGGTELFHLVVGKSADRGGEFVRAHASEDVYLTPARLASSFGIWGDEPKAPEAKRWIDLQVHKADRNDVDRLVLRRESQEVVLEKVFEEIEVAATADDTTATQEPQITTDRTKWTWKPDGAGEFDKNTVDGILGTLCSIYASDVADPAQLADYGLGDDARVAVLTFQDGTVRSIAFGAVSTADEGRVYLRVDDGDPAEIFKNTADRFFKDRSDLSPKQES